MSNDEPCWCADCEETQRRNALAAGGDIREYVFGRFMILCPDCGNKRCPRATSHENECTGSNDGQPGGLPLDRAGGLS